MGIHRAAADRRGYRTLRRVLALSLIFFVLIFGESLALTGNPWLFFTDARAAIGIVLSVLLACLVLERVLSHRRERPQARDPRPPSAPGIDSE